MRTPSCSTTLHKIAVMHLFGACTLGLRKSVGAGRRPQLGIGSVRQGAAEPETPGTGLSSPKAIVLLNNLIARALPNVLYCAGGIVGQIGECL